jgi:hypothetical protein
MSDDSMVFLEIKRKDVDSISKDRVALLYRNLEEFLGKKDFSLLDGFPSDNLKKKIYARNFLYYYQLYNLQPSVVVAYEREAFECKFGSGLRVTLDKNVRTRRTKSFSELYEDAGMVPSFKDCFAVEVKFQRILPKWLLPVLTKYNIRRASVPKYSWSIETVFKNQLIKYLN